MALSLSEVLDHPSLAPAHPVPLTGGDHANRLVRWIHSSEVLEVAPLLRGGELLLTGGRMLFEAGAERQRAYIRDLSAHGVSAVAVETVAAGSGLPEALVDEARRQEFALIRLDRTVPFVQVTESINGLLISDSVQRLRIADSLSDTLSAQLTSGAGPQQLSETLASATGAGVVVRDGTGDLLATAPVTEPDIPVDCEPRHAPITVHGVTNALLELRPSADMDPPVLEAALDRAPQAFALALLRARPPAPGDRAGRALFRSLLEPAPVGTEFAPLIEAAGLHSGDSFVAVAATHAEAGFYGALEQAMRRGGRNVLSHTDSEFLALAGLAPHRAASFRRALLDDLEQVSNPAHDRPTIGVGPVVADSARLPHTVAEARRCLEPDLRHAAVHGVVDAESCSLQRLVHQLDADEPLRGFVDEHLGNVLRQPPRTRQRLLSTLETFFDCGGNKTEAAQRLHLRRQTLYQRLNALSRHLGFEVADPTSSAELQVAVRLLRALDKRAAAPGTSSA